MTHHSVAGQRLSALMLLPEDWTMTRTARIECEIIEFLTERGGGEELAPRTDLLASGILDSLLIMDLIAHLEHAYCIRLKNDDVAPANFRTPAALAGLIDARRSA